MSTTPPADSNDDENTPEASASGAPIYRYDDVEPAEFRLAFGDEQTLAAISDHIERHVGPIGGVFHELVSDQVHLDVYIVELSAEYPFYVLVTSGMSDLPMTTPAGAEDARYAELCIVLPSTWNLSDIGPDAAEEDYWPIRWLKFLARFPHDYRTWIGFGHTIPNGETAEPFADNTDLGCMLLLPSISLPEAFQELRLSADKTVHFHCLYPLYREEMDLKMRKGYEELLDKFEERGITDVVDPRRPNVARKKGLFGLW